MLGITQPAPHDNDTLDITLNNGEEYHFRFSNNIDRTENEFNNLYTLEQAIANTKLDVAVENDYIRINSKESSIKEITGKMANYLGLAVDSSDLKMKFSGTNGGSINGKPDVTKGEFNDMLTLAKAINTMGNGEVQAEVIEKGKQLKITTENSAKILHISDLKGDIAKNMGLHSADIVASLGMDSIDIASNTFNSLGGLGRLINADGRFISQDNQNSISIFADDVLSTVSFDNSSNNSADSDLLSTLGISDNIKTPKYDPLDESKNMSSGMIKPSFSNSTKIYDSLGTSHNLHMSYIKFAPNQWGMEISVSPDEVENHRQDGLIAYANLDFSGDGKIDNIDFYPVDNGGNDQAVKVKWANKAEDDEINFNLGTKEADGFKQFSANYNVNSIEQDGYEMGDVKRIFIDEKGIINGVFTNGSIRKLYQIPIIDFPNMNGLVIESHNMYSLGKDSGSYRMRVAGEGNAGSIVSQMLEGSNVTLSDQITKIIKTKHAYQMHSKVIQTADRLLEEIARMISA